MRQRSPRTSDMTSPSERQTDRMPECVDRMDDAITRYHRDTESRSGKFIRWATVSTLGAVAAGAVWLGGDVVQGVREGHEAVQSSHASVHEVSTNASGLDVLHRHHGTFVLTGLGTKNPTSTAEILAVHREVGQVFALEYSNRDLDTKDMARRVIAMAAEHGLSEISFDGYSAGGPIALDIAAHIRSMAPQLNIVAIVLNSSPIGEGSLTQQSQEGIDLMQTILSVDPDLAYYRKGRIATELLARSDRYTTKSPGKYRHFTLLGYNSFEYRGIHYETDYPEILEQLRNITDKLRDEDAASAMLIWEQAKFIVRTDYAKNIRQLQDDTIIVYTRALHEGADPVVAVDASERNFVTTMQHLGRRYLVLKEDIGHANPAERKGQYARMIHDKIQPHINNRLIKIVLSREMARQAIQPKVSDLARAGATPTTRPPG